MYGSGTSPFSRSTGASGHGADVKHCDERGEMVFVETPQSEESRTLKKREKSENPLGSAVRYATSILDELPGRLSTIWQWKQIGRRQRFDYRWAQKTVKSSGAGRPRK